MRFFSDLMRLFPIDAVFLLDCIYVPLLILLYILEISTILKVSFWQLSNAMRSVTVVMSQK